MVVSVAPLSPRALMQLIRRKEGSRHWGMGGALIPVSRSDYWWVRRRTLQRRTMIVPQRYTVQPRPSSEHRMGGSRVDSRSVRERVSHLTGGRTKLIAERPVD